MRADPLKAIRGIRVCREYLIIVGSIPNGAGTMVLWFCSFLSVLVVILYWLSAAFDDFFPVYSPPIPGNASLQRLRTDNGYGL